MPLSYISNRATIFFIIFKSELFPGQDSKQKALCCDPLFAYLWCVYRGWILLRKERCIVGKEATDGRWHFGSSQCIFFPFWTCCCSAHGWLRQPTPSAVMHAQIRTLVGCFIVLFMKSGCTSSPTQHLSYFCLVTNKDIFHHSKWFASMDLLSIQCNLLPTVVISCNVEDSSTPFPESYLLGCNPNPQLEMYKFWHKSHADLGFRKSCIRHSVPHLGEVG